jgi:hypothetical protein
VFVLGCSACCSVRSVFILVSYINYIFIYLWIAWYGTYVLWLYACARVLLSVDCLFPGSVTYCLWSALSVGVFLNYCFENYVGYHCVFVVDLTVVFSFLVYIESFYGVHMFSFSSFIKYRHSVIYWDE